MAGSLRTNRWPHECERPKAHLADAANSPPALLATSRQGILGTTPWLALVWITLYLQLLGMSDLQASLVMASFLGANAAGAGARMCPAAEQPQGCAAGHAAGWRLLRTWASQPPNRRTAVAGGLIGGLLGDWAVQRWRNHGRVFVCRLSVSLGVPLSGLLFKVGGLWLPGGPGSRLHPAVQGGCFNAPCAHSLQGMPLSASPWAALLYAFVLVCTGLTITWAATACNNPIFSGGSQAQQILLEAQVGCMV